MSNTASRVIVRIENLIAIEPFISTEITRQNLNGVHIAPHPKGAVIVATDGHALVMLFDPDTHCAGPPQIWRPQAKRLGNTIAAWRKTTQQTTKTVWCDMHEKAAGGLDATISAVAAESVQEVLDGKGDMIVTLSGPGLMIDGTYPEYLRVLEQNVPDGGPDLVAALSTKQLKRLADFGAALDLEYSLPSIRFWSCGRGAVRAQIAGSDAVILIMGMRDGKENTKYVAPEWLSDYIEANTVQDRKAA